MKTKLPIELFLRYEQEVAQFKLDLIRRLSSEAPALDDSPKKRMYKISMVEAVLVTAGKPMHIKEIISAIERDFGVTMDRDSLASAIVKNVRKEKRFVRAAPNTYGLRRT